MTSSHKQSQQATDLKGNTQGESLQREYESGSHLSPVPTARQDKARLKRLNDILNGDYQQVGPLPGNKEQEEAVVALRSKACVILSGEVGSGKTLIALGTYFDMLVRGDISYIVVGRPKVPSDHGFYKGDKMEKVLETLGSMKDAMRHILGNGYKEKLERLIKEGFLEVEALDDIKGRSFSHAALFVDEVQDAFPEDVEGVLTRISDNAYVTIAGDPRQISRKMKPLFKRAGTVNGLSAAINALDNGQYVAKCYLPKVVRHPLTEIVKRSFDVFYEDQQKFVAND